MEAIIVPLDEFRLSEAAVPVAASLARRVGAKLHLIAVSSPGIDPLGPETYLEEQAEGVDGPLTTQALFDNDVVRAVVDYADAQPRSLVCMGAHGRTGVARVLGSVSDGVIRELHRPVLVVGPAASTPPPPTRILVCLDKSKLAETVLAPVVDLAAKLDAAIELFHVDTALDGATLADMAYLDRLARSITDVKVDIAHVKGASAGRSIVRYAAQHRIGMIAMATHGRSGLSGALLGSVAQQVVHRAPCPTLILHPGGLAL